MKADKELQIAVVEALKDAPEVTASEVGVAVSGGAVRLSGVVHTYSEKYAAERAALSVADVRAVSEEIQVQSARPDGGGDGSIAKAVARALQEADVPSTVQATVEGGWTSLQGEVASEAQRDAAVEAVRHRAGVERIYNLVTIQPTVRPVGVKKEVEEAPHPNGDVYAECVAV
jgi:osmotically-inducible protein OsmY